MFIEGMKELLANTPIEGTFVVSNCQYKAFKQKEGHFLAFNLSDKTGQISCTIWDNIEKYKGQIKNKIVVDVKGTISIFKNKPTLVVTKIKETSEYNKDNLMVSLTDTHRLHLLSKLFRIRKTINRNYHSIWDTVLDHPKFKICPGGVGVVHHNYLGGLIEHTFEMITEAMTVCKTYENIDYDLLLTGILIHDIGKIRAYNWNTVIEMSDEGRLLGHITIGINILNQIDPDLSDIIIRKLTHIILSHHGEHGMIKPMFLEAAIVSNIDSNSATINHIAKFVEENKQDGSNWTQWDNLRSTFYFNENETEVEIPIEENTRKIEEDSDDRPY